MSRSLSTPLLATCLALAVTGCSHGPLKDLQDKLKGAHKTEQAQPQRKERVDETPPKKFEPTPPRKPEPLPPEKPAHPASHKGEQELNWGMRNYEEGDYKSAARNFRNALESGLPGPSEQVTAHKYLAFIHCVSDEKAKCREEFRKAFAINPKFDLSPAEAGHPIWGPVFTEVRAETIKKPRKP